MILERRGDGLPIHLVVAWRAAVTAAGVEMAEDAPALRMAAAGFFSRCSCESVQVQFERRMRNLANHSALARRY